MTTISKFQFEQMQRRLRSPSEPPPDPPPEKYLHRDIMDYCDSQWPRWKYIHSRMDKSSRNAIGTPDFVIALPGRVTIYVEAKRPGEKPTLEQRNFIAELLKLGQLVYVVHDMREFVDAVENAFSLFITSHSQTTNHQPSKKP